jgi:hypothetical protein
MQPKLPREFAGPLGLDLTGPAGTRVAISSDGAAITVTPGTDSTFEPGQSSPRQQMTSWRGRPNGCPGSSWYRSRVTVMRRPASSTPSTSSRAESGRIWPNAVKPDRRADRAGRSRLTRWHPAWLPHPENRTPITYGSTRRRARIRCKTGRSSRAGRFSLPPARSSVSAATASVQRTPGTPGQYAALLTWKRKSRRIMPCYGLG